MTHELAKIYRPADVESDVAARWERANAFHAEPDAPGNPYAIVIPPPNVTAALHMGHALNNTIQDILIRYHRMLGDNAMWMPGTDHAGIATQTVVEKRVLAEEGKRRTDFQRDAFVAKIQAWKDEYEKVITNQLKAMGCSCDWQRQRFTMDEICARAVREAFFTLFKDGLIYRGKRLVNWDPVTLTALADDEVEMHDIDGHFWYLNYPLAQPASAGGLPDSGHGTRDTGEFVTVATTRPETMLGDTAVAVNPNDPQRAHLIGKFVRLPIVNRIIPIIGDDYVVIPDPDSEDAKARYASGFLKVTPAHDPNDYDIGLRHDLPVINVMAPDATISDQHGWPPEDVARADADALPLGLDRYEARQAIVDWFRTNNLLAEVKPYRHSVGHSYRSHVPIEPYLSDQWYVKVTDDRLRGAALRAMAADQRNDLQKAGTAGPDAAGPTVPALWEGQLRFYPPRYANTFRGWHENIRDWCISRQLWWGHRIPVWHGPLIDLTFLQSYEASGEVAILLTADGAVEDDDFSNTIENFVCLRSTIPELEAQLAKLGFTQDPDVLDTWFSSALWPMSTLGWPESTPELRAWNPTSVLCTAREIITLWVSRMVMFNLYFLDRLPFRDVFIHAMIQDGEGRKMSKTLGNGVDPLDIIHSHGSDAMRFTLAGMTTNTQDVRMPVVRDPETGRNTSEKFDAGRNFANKMWNAVRFALTRLAESAPAEPASAGGLSSADAWILARLAATINDATTAIERYEFADYAKVLYDFFWRDLCDWYIEAVKPTVAANSAQRQVLATCIDASLRLSHPVMPFITEKLWEHLNEVMPDRRVDGIEAPMSELLIKAPWPRADATLARADVQPFTLVQEVVAAIRQVRTQHKVAPRTTVEISIQTRDAEAHLAQKSLIQTLANVTLIEVGPGIDRPADAAVATRGEDHIYLHHLIDPDAERTRLTRRVEELTKSIAAFTSRLANKSYADKAPAHLVQQTRDQLAQAQRELQTINEQLGQFI